jgi:hypothetical protein
VRALPGGGDGVRSGGSWGMFVDVRPGHDPAPSELALG